MAHFFAVTAIRSDKFEDVVEVIFRECEALQCSLAINETEDHECETDAQIYQDASGWILINWPNYFNLYDHYFAEKLSFHLNTLVSTISIYEGSLWTHVLYELGEELHRFCNIPDYFDEANQLTSDSSERGVKLVAEKFNVEIDRISGYFSYLSEVDDEPRFDKVHVHDEFEVWDFWVFCDFWAQAGIIYPEDEDYLVSSIRFYDGFEDKLITNVESQT